MLTIGEGRPTSKERSCPRCRDERVEYRPLCYGWSPTKHNPLPDEFIDISASTILKRMLLSDRHKRHFYHKKHFYNK